MASRKNMFDVIVKTNKALFEHDLPDYSIDEDRKNKYLSFYKDSSNNQIVLQYLLNHVRYISFEEIKAGIRNIAKIANHMKTTDEVFIIYIANADSKDVTLHSDLFYGMYISQFIAYDDVACNVEELKQMYHTYTYTNTNKRSKKVVIVVCDDATYSGKQSYMPIEHIVEVLQPKDTNHLSFLIAIPYHLGESMMTYFLTNRHQTDVKKIKRYMHYKPYNYLPTANFNLSPNKDIYQFVNEISIESIENETKVKTCTVYDLIRKQSVSKQFQCMYLQTRMPDLMSISILVMGVILDVPLHKNKTYFSSNAFGRQFDFYPIIKSCQNIPYHKNLLSTCPPPYQRSIQYMINNEIWKNKSLLEVFTTLSEKAKMYKTSPRASPSASPRASPRTSPQTSPRTSTRTSPRTSPRTSSRTSTRTSPRTSPRLSQ